MERLAQLVLRAQGGDVDAYGTIVKRFRDMAYGYAYSYLKNFGWAEDVTQEAFIEAYRELAKLRKPEVFPGWLRKIVFKHCDRVTRNKHLALVPLEETDGVASTEPGPAEAYARRQIGFLRQ